MSPFRELSGDGRPLSPTLLVSSDVSLTELINDSDIVNPVVCRYNH